MREILFRGKRVGFNEWIEGYYFQRKNNECVEGFVAAQMSECAAEFKPVYPETVGQYTGLTDKNGKKIFEGDIVRTKFGRLCKIRFFVSSCFCGVDLFPLKIEHRPPTEYDMYRKDFLEVIGNIHDNPELLEDKP